MMWRHSSQTLLVSIFVTDWCTAAASKSLMMEQYSSQEHLQYEQGLLEKSMQLSLAQT